MSLMELPETNVLLVHIFEKPESQPLRYRPYRTNAEDSTELSQQIVCLWRAAGIVTDTVSPYAGLAFLVEKKTFRNDQYLIFVD